MTLTRRPSIVTHRWCSRQSTSSQGERPAGTVVAGRVGQACEARPPCRRRIIGGTGAPRRMRIAIDIDSTLHHYWDELAGRPPSAASASTLPYDQQYTWKISRLRDEQLRAVHRRHALRRGHRPRRALPARGRDRQRAGTRPATGSTSPATAPSAATGDEHWLDGHRPALRRPALLLRQDQPLRRARHRRPHRRQPGHPRPRARGRHGGRDARAPVEPGPVRGGGRGRLRRRLARASAAALELRLPRLRRAA